MKKALFLLLACVIAASGFAQLGDNLIHVSCDKNSGRVTPDREGYQVVSYELGVIQKERGDMIGPYYVEARRAVSEEVKRCIKNMVPGDKLVIENIKLQELESNKTVQAASYYEVLK